MIAIPIAYAWILLALTMWCWNRALDFGEHAKFWCYFTIVGMIPATAIGTCVLAALLA